MYNVRLLSATAGLLFLASPLSAELCGPDYAPPFESRQSKRQMPKLLVKSFIDDKNKQPADGASLVVGNKRISVREKQNNQFTSGQDNIAAIFINSKPVFEIIFAGGFLGPDNKSVGFAQGYKAENAKLVCDQAGGTIKWLNSYPLPEGSQGIFAYQMKPLGDSQVELSWDLGCTAEQAAANKIDGCLMYFSMPEAYRQGEIEINGALLKPQSDAALKQADQKGIAVWQGKLDKLVCNPGKPLDGFTITMTDAPLSFCTEKFAYGRYSLGFRLNGKPQGRLVIDFGETAVAKLDTPPAVEGHDLWAQDALHLPKSPTKNLFPNPSFEQGLSYWRWWGGGAKYEPSNVMRYEVDRENGLFGRQAMVINPLQRNSAPLRSFSMPGAKGQTYTLSFYAKAEKEGAGVRLAPYSSKQGGKFTRQTVNDTKSEIPGPDWRRFSYSFVSDGTPISFILLAEGRGGRIWLDALQLEASQEATKFAAPPLEGELTTSHHQNNVEFGDNIVAKYAVRGEAGTKGKVSLELRDFFKEPVWSRKYDTQAGETLDLPFDDLKLGTGVYLLKSSFEVPGAEPYVAYYRFTVIDSLDGTHATKDLYGALISARITRSEEALALMQRLGFAGSSSYGGGRNADPIGYALREKFNITDYTHEVVECPHLTAEQKRARHPDYLLSMSINPRTWRTPEERKVIPEWETYSDEVLKRFEDLCERVARECPYVRVWSIATEEEGVFPALKNRDFQEFAKLQEVFYRGIKHGNPNALVLPSGGTSGYGKTRGREDIDGFLSATHGKVKWDAVAIHPYGAIDGTLGAGDLDESVQMLRESMVKYDYGEETPILLNEGGGGSSNMWGDGPFWSYDGGQPSYDQGLMEFLHACKMARQYIICLKYWPQLPHFNTWQMDERWIVDHNLTPSSFLLGINTLGHMLAKPQFIADIRPAPGMRGYAFKDDKGNGVAAVWCTIDNVELGFERGPEMRVKFTGPMPEMFDLMGKLYPLVADKDGYVKIRLTPAPLFFRSASLEKLVAALKDAEVSGAGTSVKTSFLPTREGEIAAKLENLTGRKQAGEILVNGQKTPFSLEPMKSGSITLSKNAKPEFGKMFQWNSSYTLAVNGKQEPEKAWKMDYFYVPHVNGVPGWDKVSAIQMTNLYRPLTNLKQTTGGHKGDIVASFKVAWDERNFYLRVEAEDDILKVDNAEFWASKEAQKNHLYILDGCLEVYFDCGANGRLRKGGFDLDDYRYDFCAGNPEGKSGPGFVNRLQEVFIEYAGGPAMPTKADVAKGIKCEFTRIDATHYAYTITFEQKYIEPLHLQKGAIAGFALYLHDRMDDGELGNKGLSLATEPGAHCDRRPEVWPLMILAE